MSTEQTVTLVMRGITKKQAKDAFDHIWGECLWGYEEDGVLRTYPVANEPSEIHTKEITIYDGIPKMTMRRDKD